MVNAYQKRLRSKTSTRSSGGGGGKVAAKAETSPKEQQWLSINAKARGITEAEFTALAAEKHEEIASLVRLVEAFCEGDPDALLAKTQDVTQWFCGGSKELTMRFPSWASLERKLEAHRLFMNDEAKLMVATVRDACVHTSHLAAARWA